MSADTSKFSLRKAHGDIHPRLEDLTFTPFRDYFGCLPEVIVKIDGVDCRFRYYEGNIMAPIGLSVDDRVFRFQVFEDIKRDGQKRITHIKTDHLILQLSKIGGTYGYWYFQESWFRPTAPGGNYYDCWKSIIRAVPNDDEGFHSMVKPSKDFGVIFWKAIMEWTAGIIQKRERRNNSVKRLNSSAIENAVIARNLMTTP